MGAGLNFSNMVALAINNTLANEIVKTDLGRDLSTAELARISKEIPETAAKTAIFQNLKSRVDSGNVKLNFNIPLEEQLNAEVAKYGDTFKQAIKETTPNVFKSSGYQEIAADEIDTRLKEQIGETLGITDEAKIDAMIDKFDGLRLIKEASKAGTGIKEALRTVDKSVSTIRNIRDAEATAAYSVAYSKATGGDTKNLQENLDEYLDSITESDVGYDALVEDDPKTRRELAKVQDSAIADAIGKDESIQASITKAKEVATEDKPFGKEEVTAQLEEARGELSDELAASRGNRTEDLRAAFKEFTDKIPEDVAKVREIAEQRLGERLEKLPEQFGEFGARLGLGVGQSGQLQQSLAEEVAFQGAETERQLQEFSLGREREAAGMGLNLEQDIANFEARQREQIAQTGFGIEQYGTQVGREDFTTQLAQQFKQAQLAQQNEYNTFLTQMGFQQNQLMQQQAFQNQLSQLYQQQGFQAQQSELDRQLKERLFNKEASLLEQQESRQRGFAKKAGLQRLGGTLLGAGLGFGIGGLTGFAGEGTKFALGAAGKGALFGAGTLGGQPSLSALPFLI